jgi:hypothetical protein
MNDIIVKLIQRWSREPQSLMWLLIQFSIIAGS